LDITSLLRVSETMHGVEARIRYRALLTAALRRIAADPHGRSTTDRSELAEGVRSFHIRHSRAESLQASRYSTASVLDAAALPASVTIRRPRVIAPAMEEQQHPGRIAAGYDRPFALEAIDVDRLELHVAGDRPDGANLLDALAPLLPPDRPGLGLQTVADGVDFALRHGRYPEARRSTTISALAASRDWPGWLNALGRDWWKARKAPRTIRSLPLWLHVATMPSMKTVTIREAKNRLTELAREVERGETIIVTRNGSPVFELAPHRPRRGLRPEAIDEFKRKHGVATIAPFIADDFDDPLPEDFLLRPLPPGA
jgi:prevent-host-death family protein